MKFTVEREHLLKPLQQVSGPLGGRPTLPILGNLLLQVADGALSLTGTDLEMEMVARVALVQPHEAGATTVPARKFFDICRGLPEGAAQLVDELHGMELFAARKAIVQRLRKGAEQYAGAAEKDLNRAAGRRASRSGGRAWIVAGMAAAAAGAGYALWRLTKPVQDPWTAPVPGPITANIPVVEANNPYAQQQKVVAEAGSAAAGGCAPTSAASTSTWSSCWRWPASTR